MTRNVINIGPYRYLIEYFDTNVDLVDNQHVREYVMFRNFMILNNIIYDKDIYIIERNFFNEYVDELKKSNKAFGNSIAFPITNAKFNSYSNSYKRFNDIFNIYDNDINSSLFDSNGELTKNVYNLYNIENKFENGKTVKKLINAKIKCDKVRIYHPLTKKKLNMIIDVCNYINGINFHYLCRPISTYSVKTDTEIKFNNEIYSEYVELYFPNISELFKIDDEGNYKVFYNEDFNIVASTRNEKFINSIMSNSEEIDHNEMIEGAQIVPLNLMIQPYRIVEEYAADSEFNYNDTVADDEKIFVKLYLKNNIANNNNNHPHVSIILYPYQNIDEHTNMYLLANELSPGYIHFHNEAKFKIMSRTGFNNGIISIVSLFDYPNKSYFDKLAKDINTYEDIKTSPIKEAWKYYNNVDDHYYNLFINEEIEQELKDIDAVDSLSPEIIQTVKEVANINHEDKDKILEMWKRIMKDTILREYEDEFQTPANFLGYKIQISTDHQFKHIIYDKNVRMNFNDMDDFAFHLNGIFKGWNEKPEQLLCKIIFYDRLLGIELISNLVIITKEWFKYLVNDNNYVPRLSDLSFINKNCESIDMNVINLNLHNDIEKLNELKNALDDLIYNKDINEIVEIINRLKGGMPLNKDENFYNKKIEEIKNDLINDVNTKKVNFINNVKCIVNKKSSDEVFVNNSTYNQKIIFKPIFYKVKDLQNIVLKPNINQKIGINLSEYLSKISTFKIIIENTEYVEVGRNNIFVIFEINSNNLTDQSGSYNLIDNYGNYISSGNWTISS